MKILGNEKQHQYVVNALNTSEAPHAFLFCGIEGVGKKLHVFQIAQSLLNIQNLSVHPDFHLLEPRLQSIGIAEIRAAKKSLSLSSFFNTPKILVINDAHTMTKEAASAFLKLLEEPSGQVIIFLVTHQPKQLLPTIVSRCLRLYFSPLCTRELSALCVDTSLSQTARENLIRLANGSAGRLLGLLQQQARHRVFLREFRVFLASSLPERFLWAKIANQRERPELIQLLRAWLYFAHTRIVKLSAPGTKSLLDGYRYLHFPQVQSRAVWDMLSIGLG